MVTRGFPGIAEDWVYQRQAIIAILAESRRNGTAHLHQPLADMARVNDELFLADSLKLGAKKAAEQ